MIRPEDLIKDIGLRLGGSVVWGEPVPEEGPGIYIVTVADDWDASTIGNQAIVYIGRSKHLRRRLNEFYKHKFGEKRPHAGGQAILKLSLGRVYWASAPDYAVAEDRLIRAFEREARAKPFGNRVRSAKLATSPISN